MGPLVRSVPIHWSKYGARNAVSISLTLSLRHTSCLGDDYSYKTGVTEELVKYQAKMAADLVNSLDITAKDLVCDIGSNDGTLLKGFVRQGVRVIGVELRILPNWQIKMAYPRYECRSEKKRRIP